MQAADIVDYLDELLSIKSFNDSSLNGLQVGGTRELTRVAFSVDANLQVFTKARIAGAQMLICHHGLLWGQCEPLTGLLYERLRLLIESGMALYAVHLPLDKHPTFGNNSQILTKLGLPLSGGFGEHKGDHIGYYGSLDKEYPLTQVLARIDEYLGSGYVHFDFGSVAIRRIGVISGGIPAHHLCEAKRKCIDLVISGETGHILSQYAEDLEIHLICLGHYRSETFGLKALMKHLSEQFPLEVVFIDHSTGY